MFVRIQNHILFYHLFIFKLSMDRNIKNKIIYYIIIINSKNIKHI